MENENDWPDQIWIDMDYSNPSRPLMDLYLYDRGVKYVRALTASTLPASGENVSSALAALDKAGKWMSAAQECQFTCRECKGDFLEALDAIEAIRAAYHNSANGGENVSNAPDVVMIPREDFDRIILRLNIIIKEGNCYNSRIDANSALEILQKHGEKK
jgi:hypothetical protein